MKALKIIGYILSALIVTLVIVIWFVIFPFSGNNADKFGFAIAVIVYSIIFAIASAVPLLIGVAGAILSGVKHKAKGLAHFIVISLLPITATALMFLSAYLV